MVPLFSNQNVRSCEVDVFRVSLAVGLRASYSYWSSSERILLCPGTGKSPRQFRRQSWNRCLLLLSRRSSKTFSLLLLFPFPTTIAGKRFNCYLPRLSSRTPPLILNMLHRLSAEVPLVKASYHMLSRWVELISSIILHARSILFLNGFFCRAFGHVQAKIDWIGCVFDDDDDAHFSDIVMPLDHAML